jgi:hypothetical protein
MADGTQKIEELREDLTCVRRLLREPTPEHVEDARSVLHHLAGRLHQVVSQPKNELAAGMGPFRRQLLLLKESLKTARHLADGYAQILAADCAGYGPQSLHQRPICGQRLLGEG